jgi:hypothetical protein
MSIEQERDLTADECDELAEALRQDAAALPDELENENLFGAGGVLSRPRPNEVLVLGKAN